MNPFFFLSLEVSHFPTVVLVTLMCSYAVRFLQITLFPWGEAGGGGGGVDPDDPSCSSASEGVFTRALLPLVLCVLLHEMQECNNFPSLVN